MGRQRKNRGFPVNGILLLDKPQGISSNTALQTAKRLFCAQKAGHTGSLDPIATGLLPLCFGNATKLSGLFLESDKRYLVKIQLGESTDTGDREGVVIARNDCTVLLNDLLTTLELFRGTIQQIPPMYSALKRNGQPLYKLARKGMEVEREPRSVTVHDIRLLDFSENIVELDVTCSKGFYIRSLAVDIGEKLGCGAHVTELRRTQVADFDIERSITLDQLSFIATAKEREPLLLAVDEALTRYPAIKIPASLTQLFKNGRSVSWPLNEQSDLVRVYSDDGSFVGVGECLEHNTVNPKKLFCH